MEDAVIMTRPSHLWTEILLITADFFSCVVAFYIYYYILYMKQFLWRKMNP